MIRIQEIKLAIWQLFIPLVLQSQIISQQNEECGIFKENKKKIDTIEIAGKISEVELLPQGSPKIKYLEKKKLLSLNHHYYSIKSKVTGCENEMWLLCSDNTKAAHKIITENLNTLIKLRCVVFRDDEIFNNNKEPFVIVTNISLK